MPRDASLLLVAALLWLAGLRVAAAESEARRLEPRFIVDVRDTEHGLPQNSVTSMIQTRDGYLWLGTLQGLVRFDGLHFTVFDAGNTPGLNSSRIVHLFEDSRGTLWIGTENAGVFMAREGQIISTGIGQYASDRVLSSACEDGQGGVWLYTKNGELWQSRDGQFTPFLYAEGRPSRCRALAAERDGSVWVGADWQLSKIAPQLSSGSLELPVQETVSVNLDFLLASPRGGHWRLTGGRIQKWEGDRLVRDLGRYPWGLTPISSACEDRQGNLIVGTLGQGLFWFESEGGAIALSMEQGRLSHNFVLSLLMDREGTLWVGTDGGGLNRVKPQDFHVLPETRGMVVQTVAEGNGLWVGFNAGYVARWNGETLQRFGAAQGMIDSDVWSVCVDRERQVWAGTWGGGLFRFQEQRWQPVSKPSGINPNITAIHQDAAGRLWLGTRGGLVLGQSNAWTVFTTTNGLAADAVLALADDRQGGLWVGTSRGLSHWREGQFSTYRKADGLPGDHVSALWLDAEGVLWVGTDSAGLARYQGGQWARYTAQHGLPSNNIRYLLEDGHGHLWLGLNAGLVRLPKEALNAFAAGRTNFVPNRTYGKADGLPSSECTSGSQPAACRTQDGRLWFPTIQGLVWVNPAQLTLNTNPPPVLIEAVLVDGQPQTPPGLRAPRLDGLRIPAGRERLDIHFTSLNLGAPAKARFKYRLADHESGWVEAGNTRVARYTKLPPGEYRFQVIACNEDGIWNNEGSALGVTVLPPFWRTWWFLVGATVFLLGGIVAGVHRASTWRLQRQVERMRQQETLERERARIARDLHDQLGASLTQVALLGELVESDKDSPEDVAAHAQQISGTARDTTRVLDEIVWAVNPSNDTLEGLITYLCKHAQEYLAVAGLKYRIEVPPNLPDRAVPPEVRHNVFLATKEAVTNIVRHAKATMGWLRMRVEPDRFVIEIEDDGQGLSEAARTSTRSGLRNMRKRMEDVGGEFEIGPGATGGTRVRFSVPMPPERAG